MMSFATLPLGNNADMSSAHQASPLALWALVSGNAFNERPQPDFYLGFVPFFEPFIEANDGKILNTDELIAFAKSTLKLPLSDDVADLFISRMAEIGWLTVVAKNNDRTVYRCRFAGDHPSELPKDVEQRIKALVNSFRAYLTEQNSPLGHFSDESIEDDLLRFLSWHFLESWESETDESGANDTNQIDYWLAKFIAWLNLNEQHNFRLVQQLSGILLLADALLELRNPSQSVNEARTLVIFLDGPLLMDYMGLSGFRAKENASYIVDRLRQAGAKIATFRHCCDEIRDNLAALLARAPAERTGPSAEAIRARQVQESTLANVRNNVEHFVKKLANVQILSMQLAQLRHLERYCDETIYFRLVGKMPAQTPMARERDANSIAIIMRRRAGEQTTDFFGSKFVLLTSNDALIRRANEVLREKRILGNAPALIGPAMHHRVVAGLLFANFGLAEKTEVSRRELLAVCARVVILRPRILDRLRQQISLLNRPEDSAVVDALLAQPRASEIIMDRTIGTGRSVSAANIEELIAAIKKTAADDIRAEFEHKLAKEKADSTKKMEAVTRDLMNQVEEHKRLLELERQAHRSERDEVGEKIARMEQQLQALVNIRKDLEDDRKADFQRFLNTSLVTASDTLKKAARREKWALVCFIALLSPAFLIPAIFTKSALAPWLGAFAAAASVIGVGYFAWNKQMTFISKFFEIRAQRSVNAQLDRLGLGNLRDHIVIDYSKCTAQLSDVGASIVLPIATETTSLPLVLPAPTEDTARPR